MGGPKGDFWLFRLIDWVDGLWWRLKRWWAGAERS